MERISWLSHLCGSPVTSIKSQSPSRPGLSQWVVVYCKKKKLFAPQKLDYRLSTSETIFEKSERWKTRQNLCKTFSNVSVLSITGELRKHADFCAQYQVTGMVLENFPDLNSPAFWSLENNNNKQTTEQIPHRHSHTVLSCSFFFREILLPALQHLPKCSRRRSDVQPMRTPFQVALSNNLFPAVRSILPQRSKLNGVWSIILIPISQKTSWNFLWIAS